MKLNQSLNKKLLSNKSLGPNGLPGEFYKTFKRRIKNLSFSNYFKKFKRKEQF